MTAPNHIVGGFVFTGLFTSLFNVNIFGSPEFFVVCFVGSLLPDIDHTRSTIGKAFYPLAKYISTHYGHRTITHSAIFIISVTVIAIIIENLFKANHDISIILFFSVFSHLLFDMVTLQGIPLFYPFFKNPCVLPANPDLRIRTGNIKQEGIILFVFAFLTFFMQDLFANGFWQTVNNKFGDFKHTSLEFKNVDKLLILDYDYKFYNNEFKGKGFLVNADEDFLYVLENNKLTTISNKVNGMKVIKLKTTKTNHELKNIKLQINNINSDSLNLILKDKFILNGKIFADKKSFLKNAPNELKKNFKLENNYNISFHNSFRDSLISERKNKLYDLDLKIETEKENVINSNKKHYQNIDQLITQKSLLKTLKNDFDINECKKRIIDLETHIESFEIKESNSIKELNRQKSKLLSENIPEVKYLGEINYFKIIK